MIPGEAKYIQVVFLEASSFEELQIKVNNTLKQSNMGVYDIRYMPESVAFSDGEISRNLTAMIIFVASKYD